MDFPSLLGSLALLAEGLVGYWLMDGYHSQKWYRKQPNVPRPTRNQSQPSTNNSKSILRRLLDFLEHPYFTLPVGILAGIIGFFVYAPVFAICGACVVLAFHRAGVVSDKSVLRVQIPSYAILCLVIILILFALHIEIQRKLKETNFSLAQTIVDLWSKTQPSAGRQSLTGFLQVGAIFFREHHQIVEAGRELQLNSVYIDRGSEPLHNAFAWDALITVDHPMGDADQKAAALWSGLIKPIQSDYFSGQSKGAEVGVGGGIWGTGSWVIPDAKRADAILDGTLRLYYFGWAAWKDYEGRDNSVTECRWLQRPNSKVLKKQDLIWHSCVPDTMAPDVEKKQEVGTLHIEHIDVGAYANRAITLRFRIKNIGSFKVRAPKTSFSVYVSDVLLSDLGEHHFFDILKNGGSEFISNPDFEMAPGEEIMFDSAAQPLIPGNESRPLTEQQAHDLESGKTNMYIMALLQYGPEMEGAFDDGLKRPHSVWCVHFTGIHSANPFYCNGFNYSRP